MYVHTCITLCYIYAIYYDINNKITTKFFTRNHSNLGADTYFHDKKSYYITSLKGKCYIKFYLFKVR